MTSKCFLLIVPCLVVIQYSCAQEKHVFIRFASNATVDPSLITSNTTLRNDISKPSMFVKCGCICYRTYGCRGFQLHYFKHRSNNGTSDHTGSKICQLFQQKIHTRNVVAKLGVYIYVFNFPLPNNVTHGNGVHNGSWQFSSTDNYGLTSSYGKSFDYYYRNSEKEEANSSKELNYDYSNSDESD